MREIEPINQIKAPKCTSLLLSDFAIYWANSKVSENGYDN